MPHSTSTSASSASSTGLGLLLGSVLVIFLSAKRKPPMLVCEAEGIAHLPLGFAKDNFMEAAVKRETAKCPRIAARYEAVARASEQRVADLLACAEHESEGQRRHHPLDVASPDWRDARKAKAK